MIDTRLACACGKVQLHVKGRPITTAECHCNSCRAAARHLRNLDGAPDFLSPNGGTPYVMMRKGHVQMQGVEQLLAYQLGESSTRRVVAQCCNTPVFLEFKGGHWLSIYKSVWPDGTMPEIELRTMTSDLADASVLDDTVPSGGTHTIGFFAKLLGAWIAMGFRTPKIEVGQTVVLR